MIKIREAREDELLKIAGLWGKFMALNEEFNSSFKIKKQALEIFTKDMIEKRKDQNCHWPWPMRAGN